MIYLSKNNQTIVITDSVIDYIPEILDIYLDDVLIGNFENQSHHNFYFEFIVPKLELEEKEYKMKIYSHYALLKEELVIVKDLSKLTIKSITEPKSIKMYEKQ